MQVHPSATFLKWKMTFFRTNPDQCEVCLQRTLRFHCWLQYASGLEDAPKTSLLFRLIEQTSDHQVDTNECEPLTRHWISWGWSVTHACRLGSKQQLWTHDIYPICTAHVVSILRRYHCTVPLIHIITVALYLLSLCNTVLYKMKMCRP